MAEIYRRHPGTETPTQRGDEPAGRNVLGLYRRLGLGWQIARFDFLARRWESVRPFLGQPDEWRELPPIPKDEVR
jgi:hypothetical protein